MCFKSFDKARNIYNTDGFNICIEISDERIYDRVKLDYLKV